MAKFPTVYRRTRVRFPVEAQYGDRSLIGKAPVCDTGKCEFESDRSPKDKGL